MFVSCKRDTKIEPEIITGPSVKYKALTSHYWKLSGLWNDTTDYAKAHPDLVPLATSIDNFFFTDSCNYYTCSSFNPDGFLYIVKKGQWCGYPYVNIYTVKDYPWSLTNNDQTLNNYGAKTIIVLNDTIMRSYEYRIYNFTKWMVTVYEFKAFVYK